MPISPKDAENKTREKYNLNRIYSYIDNYLSEHGLDKTCTLSVDDLPDMLINEIVNEYRKIDWVVAYDKIPDTRDGNYIKLTFSR